MVMHLQRDDTGKEKLQAIDPLENPEAIAKAEARIEQHHHQGLEKHQAVNALERQAEERQKERSFDLER